jgi:hypothetical protein
MQVNRRQFLQSSMFAGAGLLLTSGKTFNYSKGSSLFGLNPFILQNPDAVFIMQTNVDVKTNSVSIKETGLSFGRSVFGLTDNADEGVPLSHKVVIKPNLTCRARSSSAYTIERSMGIVTDAFFVEGIIESLKELGIASGQFYIREVNCPDDLEDGGYLDMAERTGIDLKGIDTPVQNLSSDKVQWINVPDGVFFRRIPYLWPVNAPDTFLLNISKFKAHGMGLTLCAKNLQGTVAMNYQAHCTSYGENMTGVNPADLNPNANSDILASYNRHKDSVPRWDKPGSTGGIWQETWATRCLDNNSVTLAGLHIIEGIYGRDGNFMVGPGQDGLATDYMTNYIIFGRNQFHVDNIGFYLGGHEPGNFGLLHMAKERKMASTINPHEIPVFKWDPASGASPANLSTFQRFPLKTYYLQRNYNYQNEPYWHLVNEYYDYGPTSVNDIFPVKNAFVLYQNFPNPASGITGISFDVPAGGKVRVDIINLSGNIVETLTDSYKSDGNHLIWWNSTKVTSGLYQCRAQYCNIVKSMKIIVNH